MPASIETFTAGDRSFHLVVNRFLHHRIHRDNRLFQSHNFILVTQLADHNRADRIGTTVVFHNQVKIISQITDCFHTILYHLHKGSGRNALALALRKVGAVRSDLGKIDLDGIVAVIQSIFCNHAVLFRFAIRSDFVTPAELQLGSVGTHLTSELAAH